MTPGTTPFGTRRGRGFFCCTWGCAALTCAAAVGTDGATSVGGGEDSRESVTGCGSAAREVRKPDVRKSRCAWAAERLVKMSACSSEC